MFITINEIVETIMYNETPDANAILCEYGLLARDIDETTVEILSLFDGSLVHTLSFGVMVENAEPAMDEEVVDPALDDIKTEDPAPLSSLTNPTPLSDLLSGERVRSAEFRSALSEALEDDLLDDADQKIIDRIRARMATPVAPALDPQVFEAEFVDAAGDERTVNNAVRHQYRVLDDEEKFNMQTVKDIGLEFLEFIEAIENESGPTRELSIAKTKVEEAVMWATKSISR